MNSNSNSIVRAKYIYLISKIIRVTEIQIVVKKERKRMKIINSYIFKKIEELAKLLPR